MTCRLPAVAEQPAGAPPPPSPLPPGLQAGVITDLVLLSTVGIRPVLVHGGGPEINSWLDKLGIEPNFKDGLRVTDGEAAQPHAALPSLLLAQLPAQGTPHPAPPPLVGTRAGQAWQPRAVLQSRLGTPAGRAAPPAAAAAAPPAAPCLLQAPPWRWWRWCWAGA